MNNNNTKPDFDLDRCRAASLRREAAVAMPLLTPAELACRERQLVADRRALLRTDRVGLAAVVFIGLLLAPTATAAAVPLPPQRMSTAPHVDRTAAVDIANQIVTAI